MAKFITIKIEDHNQDFVNGFETSVLLDFNVDGCIIDKLTY